MIKLAIDLGSAVTKIYKIGSGIVLAEPSYVAINTADNTVKAIGEDAKLLEGKTSDYTTIVYPIANGEIVNVDKAYVMLQYFLNKVGIKKGGCEVLFCLHCGMQEVNKENFYILADKFAFKEVSFVENPILAGMGQDVALTESNPVFAIDIGYGVTDIAAYSLDGILAGISMNLGGGSMDIHIIDHVADLYGIKIGRLTSEKIKNTIGSMIYGDNQSMEVPGRDIASGKPRVVDVYAPDIFEPIQIYIDKIIEYAEMVLSKLPAEVSASIVKDGIYLSGGTANIPGLANYIAEKLQMEVHVAEEPQMTVILGGGRAVGNPQLLKRLRIDM